ncbi:MAG: ABC transporter substrate-binding protein [Elusimicrobiota bacterium]
MKINLILIIILSFLGCSHQENNFSVSPRYVSLSPANTEILYELGLEKNIVGVTSQCDYPKKAQEKTIIGDFANPSIEKIVSLEPDIIFASGPPQERAIKKLTDFGYNIYTSNPSTIKELFRNIKNIGEITNTKNQSQKLITEIKSVIEDVRKRISNYDRKKVYIEISSRPMMTVGKNNFINEMVSIAGGMNIGEQEDKSFFTISYEYLIKRNPDVIVIFSQKAEKRKERLKSILKDNVDAVKNNRIYPIKHKDVYIRPGPRIAQGIKNLADLFLKGMDR